MDFLGLADMGWRLYIYIIYIIYIPGSSIATSFFATLYVWGIQAYIVIKITDREHLFQISQRVGAKNMAAISGAISGAIEGPIVMDMLETSKSQNEQKNVTIADPGYIYMCVPITII